MKMLLKPIPVGLTALSGVWAAQANAADPRLEVTVTNLTRGQVFTPILVASHREGVTLFTLGQPAGLELEIVAEAGDTGPLKAALAANPSVREVTDSGAPLPPGRAVTLSVQTGGGFDHLSVAAMLVPTNDGFFAANDIEGPHGKQLVTHFSPAYDAGTEANDELCAHIPGPPTACQGEGFDPSRAGAEGYVHIHAGIHGIGNLAPPRTTGAIPWRRSPSAASPGRARSEPSRDYGFP